MKITNITSYLGKKTYLVKVETDEGITGYGQCSPMNIEAVSCIIHKNIKPEIIGMNPFDIEKIEDVAVKKNYKFAGQLLAMAFSGIEIALWDIKGKYLSQPIYNLLGGLYRDKIEMYGSSMSRNLSIEEECEKVKNSIEKYGFKAVKIKTGTRMGGECTADDIEYDVEKVKAIRKVIGSSCKLIIDGNSSYTYFQALQLYEKIKEYDIYIFEEPCPYYDRGSYEMLSRKLAVPVNLGEQDWNIFTFKDFISQGLVQYCASDITKCGGFNSIRKIAALCRAFGIFMSPHDTSWGIGMAANLQMIASSPECNAYHEYSIEEKNEPTFLLKDFSIKEGILEVPKGPGLGIEMDIERIQSTLNAVI